MESIGVALISLVGIIITALITRNSFSHELDKKIVVIEEHLKTIDKKITEHNGYAQKFSESSTDIALIQKDIKYLTEGLNALKGKQ